MDKGTITALKLAGYIVKPTRDNFGDKCWDWVLNMDSDWEYEAESDYFFDTKDDAWESALKHLQTGESE